MDEKLDGRHGNISRKYLTIASLSTGACNVMCSVGFKTDFKAEHFCPSLVVHFFRMKSYIMAFRWPVSAAVVVKEDALPVLGAMMPMETTRIE